MLRQTLRAAAYAAFCSAVPLTAVAQSMSASDIRARVDAKVGAVNEYQELLNDPDPVRSMAAMEVMLDSRDPALMRMALDYGVYSPNPQVQFAALKAFFDSGPVIRVIVDGSSVNDQDYLARSFRELGGSVDDRKIGHASLHVGAYSPSYACYLFASSNNACLVRVSELGVEIRPWRNAWYPLRLNDRGELVGAIGAFTPPARVTVPVTN